ncbi:hypothetical protein JVT61DRAFT_7173 [Boletus reticuloceps]|uniref:Uncharacterized protein n=1 Tax=Boletus reticuloceps TaxID=495285 RepID=A0A8I2YI68_9AGAM|nr:hypothetical protein JVT61DRAFT_7173 [Boletus reticuloceps]
MFSWFALGNYYIDFVIVTNVLEDYLSIFHWPNLVLNYFYLGLLIMSFLGNRPQGAKWAYTLALLGFALIMVYMTVRFTCFTPVELLLTLA